MKVDASMRDPELTGRQFRNRLKQAGVSQRRFALWLGFDAGTVYRWSGGRRTVPQYVAVIASVLAKYPEIAALAAEQRMP
jgi:hypothetical protein